MIHYYFFESDVKACSHFVFRYYENTSGINGLIRENENPYGTDNEELSSKELEKTILARDMELLSVKDVDKACKNILANMEIVSRLLKVCLAEYREETLHTIMSDYLEYESDHSLEHPENAEEKLFSSCNGDTVLYSDERVLRLNTEFLGEEEGKSQLDVKLKVRIPDSDSTKKMTVEIEGQGDYYPGYPLEARGIFYCSRMISEQKGVEMKGDHYQDLCKVAGIWVCYDVPAYLQNTISVYRIGESNLYGHVERKKQNYDLMTVVIICLGKVAEVDQKESLICYQGNPEEMGHKQREFIRDAKELLKLLDIIFVEKMETEEKLSLIEEQFGIVMRKKMEGQVNDMCTIGEAMALKAIREGLQQGIQQGRSDTRREMVLNMKGKGLSIENIALYTEIPINEVIDYVNGVS